MKNRPRYPIKASIRWDLSHLRLGVLRDEEWRIPPSRLLRIVFKPKWLDSEEFSCVIELPDMPNEILGLELAQWISTFGYNVYKQGILSFYLRNVPKCRPLQDGGRLYLLINALVPGNMSQGDLEATKLADGWEIIRGVIPPVSRIRRKLKTYTLE